MDKDGWPKPTTLDELEKRIRHEVSLLTPEEIRKACIQGMRHRVDEYECITNDGHYGNYSR